MEILIVVLAVVLLFVDYLVAGAFYDIAKMKGYNSRKYYKLCDVDLLTSSQIKFANAKPLYITASQFELTSVLLEYTFGAFRQNFR